MPGQIQRVLKSESADPSERAQMASPDLIDTFLNYGSLIFPEGYAVGVFPERRRLELFRAEQLHDGSPPFS